MFFMGFSHELSFIWTSLNNRPKIEVSDEFDGVSHMY